ncbi:MAG TPA: carboxypeptidase regulatory-like domain-containing protein [Terracidiphilus sp.]|nr:carboxypeptidase regulatory-like domain-containing protein [Terracidiphilus sp.]
MKVILRLAVIVILLSAFAWRATAQTSSGTISGRVTDASGAVVPGASIELTEQGTNTSLTARALSDGNFVFPVVQPGTYSITVRANGFKVLVKHNMVLTSNERLSAGNLTLEVGAVTQSVVVSSDITPVQTTSAENSGDIDVHQLDNELAIGRDFMALVRLVPGVVGSNGSGSLGGSTTPYVNGLRNVYNSANLDGVSGTPRPGQSMDTSPNLDSISEVKILTAGYQAEYGQGAGGAVINVVTKSGTQQFHGTAYYYGRNEALNANDWFNKYNGAARSRYRFNTVGGNIGGPIFWPNHFNTAKNKLFFFYSQEYWPDKTPGGLQKYMVPTDLERTGDFSQTPLQGVVSPTAAQYINIKMPGAASSTCPASGTTGDHSGCYTGNVVPLSAINPSFQALLKVFPLPNFTNRAVSSGNYNYVTNYPKSTPITQEIARVDFNPTEKLRMYGRVLFTVVNNDGYNSTANKLPWLMTVNYQTPRQNIGYDVTYTISPTLLNEFIFGTSTFAENQIYKPSQLALATKNANGYNLGQIYSSNNPLNLYPAVSFGGVTNTATYGWDSRFPMYDRTRWWSATDNLTKVLGSHNLKFGFDWATDHYLQAHSSSGIPEGSFSFNKDSNNPNDSNYAYANAIQGLFDTYSEPTGRNDYNPRIYVYEWFGQDQWRVTPKLTLDYGARFAWVRPPSLQVGANFVPNTFNASQAPALYQYAPGGKNAVDPTTGMLWPRAYAGLFVPNTGSLSNGLISTKSHAGYPEGLVHGMGLQIGPRVGFAYDPFGSGKTAIRAHFGIFINPATQMGQEGDMTHNPPIEYVPTQYYGNANSFTTIGGLIGPPSFGSAFEQHPKETKVYGYGLQVQQQVGFGAVLSVGYVGNVTRHLTGERNINEVPYGAEFLPQNNYCSSLSGGACKTYSPLPDNFFRAYPGYSTITYRTTGFTSNYNAMQVQVTRRYANGLDFGLAYTWSKYMDVADEYDTSVATFQPIRVWNYGPALEDHRQNLAMNYLYDIPNVSRVWNNFAAKAILNHWQLSGIVTYLSGAPVPLSYSTADSVNTTGGGDGARVVLTCNPLQGAPHKWGEYFNTSCVQRPSTGAYDITAGQQVYSNGISPMDAVQDPGHWDFQTALFKNFVIKERYSVQLRLETYNTFNSPEFDGINAAAKYSAFTGGSTVNTINGPVMVNGTTTQINNQFGQINSSAGPRIVQLAGRINF